MPQERGSRAWGPGEGSGEDTGFFLWRWGEQWVKGRECEMGLAGQDFIHVPLAAAKEFYFVRAAIASNDAFYFYLFIFSNDAF